MKTAVVATGYVEIATAVGVAEQGHDILLVEQEPERLSALGDGRIPFHEPGLPEAHATQHAVDRIVPSTANPGDGLGLMVISIGTPIEETGTTDVSQVETALGHAGPAIAAGAVCVIRSTVPVGSPARIENRPAVVPERFFVAPEFLRKGRLLEDIRTRTRAEPT